ncbi:hypothetical protein D3C84_896000 [compost metagenome]
MFDGFRVFDAAVQGFSDQYVSNGNQPTKQGGDQDDQGLFRFNRLFNIHIRRVDDADVANGTRPNYIQLLGLVQ